MGIVESSPSYMEQTVLGCILIDSCVFGLVHEVLTPEDFWDERCRVLYGAMIYLENRKEPIDIPTIASLVMGHPQFAHENVIAFMIDMQSNVPSAMFVESYANRVKEASKKRRALSIMQLAPRTVNSVTVDADTSILDICARLEDLTKEGVKPWSNGQSVMCAAFEEIDNAQKNGNKGIKTGFTELDDMLCGLMGGALYIIAARPAMGKTAFALNIMLNAIRAGKHIAFFSLEMAKTELGVRLISQGAHVDSQAMKKGSLSNDDWARVCPFISDFNGIYANSMIIDDTPAIDVLKIRERMRNLVKTHGIEMMIVDYIQLIRSSDKRINNREQEIADISRSLKAIAKENNIPVIALAQLNRAVDSRTEKRPVLSDLRESGSIEQDADCVMFIHREEYYKKTEDNKNKAEIIIAKHRSGPTGIATLHWDGRFTQFSNLANQDERF